MCSFVHNRNRERLGVVRVSTAYEFYEAVRDHLKLSVSAYVTKEKPLFEATKYMLFYVASSADDALNKECAFALDRTGEKWDCTGVSGSSGSYEFSGLSNSTIQMRYLPCACVSCQNNNIEECTNQELVGQTSEHHVELKVHNCPEYLTAPVEANHLYTITTTYSGSSC
jgi:hypothetical protein